MPKTTTASASTTGSIPVVAFVNSRSGGKQGKSVRKDLEALLQQEKAAGEAAASAGSKGSGSGLHGRVFDLGEDKGPQKGLQWAFDNYSQNRFLCLVCGGDGTVGWVLGAMDEMGLWGSSNEAATVAAATGAPATPLPTPPAVAVLPLGTGNDMARALGWGPGYSGEDLAKVLAPIHTGTAVPIWVDRWQLICRPLRDEEFTNPKNLAKHKKAQAEEAEEAEAKAKDKDKDKDSASDGKDKDKDKDKESASDGKAKSDQTPSTERKSTTSSSSSSKGSKHKKKAGLSSNDENVESASSAECSSSSEAEAAQKTPKSKKKVVAAGKSDGSPAPTKKADDRASATEQKDSKTPDQDTELWSESSGSHFQDEHFGEDADASEAPPVFKAIMCNYFSIGYDAEIALGFHHMREKHRGLFSSRFVNKAWYGVFIAQTTFKIHGNIFRHIRLSVDGKDAPLDSSLRMLVFLNVPSHGGGVDLWGRRSGVDKFNKKAAKKNETIISYQMLDDHKLEVVGALGVAHMGTNMLKATTGRHIGQASEVVMINERPIPAQVDGEPWPLVPSETRIVHHRQSAMLFNPSSPKNLEKELAELVCTGIIGSDSKKRSPKGTGEKEGQSSKKHGTSSTTEKKNTSASPAADRKHEKKSDGASPSPKKKSESASEDSGKKRPSKSNSDVSKDTKGDSKKSDTAKSDPKTEAEPKKAKARTKAKEPEATKTSKSHPASASKSSESSSSSD